MNDVEGLRRSVEEIGSNWIVDSWNVIGSSDIVPNTSVSFEETIGGEDEVAIKKDILIFLLNCNLIKIIHLSVLSHSVDLQKSLAASLFSVRMKSEMLGKSSGGSNFVGLSTGHDHRMSRDSQLANISSAARNVQNTVDDIDVSVRGSWLIDVGDWAKSSSFSINIH